MMGSEEAGGPEATSPDIVQAAAQFLLYMESVQHSSPSTLTTYGLALNSFARWLEARFGRLPTPAEVTREVVAQYCVTLGIYSAATIRRHIATIRSLFT